MKQFIRLTALLIIIGVVVTTMVSCGKRLNEDKLDKASLFFASELSGKNSDDIDDSALKEIFEKAQERYAEDIVYYEFMYYFF